MTNQFPILGSRVDLAERVVRPLPIRPSHPEHARDGARCSRRHHDPEFTRANLLAPPCLFEGWHGAARGRGHSPRHRKRSGLRRQDSRRAARPRRDRRLIVAFYAVVWGVWLFNIIEQSLSRSLSILLAMLLRSTTSARFKYQDLSSSQSRTDPPRLPSRPL